MFIGDRNKYVWVESEVDYAAPTDPALSNFCARDPAELEALVDSAYASLRADAQRSPEDLARIADGARIVLDSIFSPES
jgi:hypothetical protein